MNCWIELGALSVMLVLTVATGGRAALMLARSRHWVKVSATVCDASGSTVPRDYIPGAGLYTSYLDPEGRPVVSRVTYLGEDPPRVGERFDVVYDPRNPKRADPHVGPIWGAVYLSVVGLVAAAVALALAQRVVSSC
jgi:hypothetical protein